jgi:hypothetical protein
MMRWLTIICAAETLVWGFWVWNPWWDVFRVSEAFRWMASFAPEWAWGLAMMLLGAAQLACALWWQRPRVRASLALLSMFTWTLIVLALVMGNWRTTGVPTYSFFVAVQTLVYVDAMTAWLRRVNGNGHTQ